MSGVYIKGLGMPKEGSWATVRIYPDGTCAVPNWQGDCTLIKGAKAVPVPDHGDLIGRNPLIDIAMHLRNRAKDEYAKRVIGSVIRYIAEAPTIIPADVPDNNVGNIQAEEGEQ